jgi:hypothetical protein
MRQLARHPATRHQGGGRRERGQDIWRNTNMNAAFQLTIEQRCLRSVRACQSLRRQMTPLNWRAHMRSRWRAIVVIRCLCY